MKLSIYNTGGAKVGIDLFLSCKTNLETSS